tara:strand:- start:366 stop:884 length:519 start_codon:yes stop_codon:yes gene_type:complete
MILTVFTWAFGILSLVLVFQASKRGQGLQKRVDNVTREYYGVSGRISELARTFRNEMPAIQIRLRQQLGKLCFEPDMTIGMALQIHPDAGQVLGLEGGAGCGSHGGNEWETIDEIAAKSEKDTEEIIQQLNGLLDGTTKLLPKTAAGFVPLTDLKKREPNQKVSEIPGIPKL